MKKTDRNFKCIESQSQFYIQDKLYPLYKHENSYYFQGEDGIFDKKGFTASKFREIKKSEDSKRKGKGQETTE